MMVEKIIKSNQSRRSICVARLQSVSRGKWWQLKNNHDIDGNNEHWWSKKQSRWQTPIGSGWWFLCPGMTETFHPFAFHRWTFIHFWFNSGHLQWTTIFKFKMTINNNQPRTPHPRPSPLFCLLFQPPLRQQQPQCRCHHQHHHHHIQKTFSALPRRPPPPLPSWLLGSPWSSLPTHCEFSTLLWPIFN